jgi:hypothetical protein
VTAASTNLTVVPTSGVVLGGGGANRTVQVTPATGQTGSTTITLTVSDGDLTTPTSFQVTVAATGSTLPDPDVVGPHRLVFMTSVSPPADETVTMPELNAFVTDLAVASGLDAAAGSPGWSVVGATTTVDVLTNTGLTATGGVPIYLVDGTLFAADYTAFWTPASAFLNVNELGVAGGGKSEVHTGLESGPVTSVNALDTALISHGGRDAGYNPWYGNGDTWGGGINSTALFAISGVIGGGQKPLLITGTSYAGPGNNFIINFTGAADTIYSVESSPDLQDDFMPIVGVTATTDEFGVGTATVPAAEVDSGKDFFRIAE